MLPRLAVRERAAKPTESRALSPVFFAKALQAMRCFSGGSIGTRSLRLESD
jgi:hypothetical protein